MSGIHGLSSIGGSPEPLEPQRSQLPTLNLAAQKPVRGTLQTKPVKGGSAIPKGEADQVLDELSVTLGAVPAGLSASLKEALLKRLG